MHSSSNDNFLRITRKDRIAHLEADLAKNERNRTARERKDHISAARLRKQAEALRALERPTGLQFRRVA